MNFDNLILKDLLTGFIGLSRLFDFALLILTLFTILRN